jgi:hypothetical protein
VVDMRAMQAMRGLLVANNKQLLFKYTLIKGVIGKAFASYCSELVKVGQRERRERRKELLADMQRELAQSNTQISTEELFDLMQLEGLEVPADLLSAVQPEITDISADNQTLISTLNDEGLNSSQITVQVVPSAVDPSVTPPILHTINPTPTIDGDGEDAAQDVGPSTEQMRVISRREEVYNALYAQTSALLAAGDDPKRIVENLVSSIHSSLNITTIIISS